MAARLLYCISPHTSSWAIKTYSKNMSTPGSILAVRANIRYLTGFCTAMRVERIDNSECNHSITVTRSCLLTLPLHEWVTSHKQFINSDILLPFVGFIIRVLILNTLKLFIFKCWRSVRILLLELPYWSFSTDGLGGCCCGDIAVAKRRVTSLSICSSIEFENKTCHSYIWEKCLLYSQCLFYKIYSVIRETFVSLLNMCN